MTVIGTGDEVRTVGELKFAKALPFEQEVWNIPTNLVYQELISFTAIRGFRPWLSSLKAWKELEARDSAEPGLLLGAGGPAVPELWRAPLPDASNCVARLTERLTKEGNAWMATNGVGKFLPSAKSNGVVWSVPLMEPYLKSVTVGGSEFVFGGLFPPRPATNGPAPPELFPRGHLPHEPGLLRLGANRAAHGLVALYGPTASHVILPEPAGAGKPQPQMARSGGAQAGQLRDRGPADGAGSADLSATVRHWLQLGRAASAGGVAGITAVSARILLGVRPPHRAASQDRRATQFGSDAAPEASSAEQQ